MLLTKEKLLLPLPHPQMTLIKSVSSRMHLRDDFSHVISEIRPKGSTHPKENSERSKGDNNNKRNIASQSGKYGFQVFLFIDCSEQLTSEILDSTLFFGYMGNIFLEIISIIIDINCQNMKVMMGVTRRDVLLD